MLKATASATLMPSTPAERMPPGVAGAFARRVEAPGVDALQVVGIALDTDGGRSPGLDPGHDGIGHVVTANLPAEGGQGLADRLDDEIGQAQGEIGEMHPRLIGGLNAAEGRGRPSGQEVANQLGRRLIGASTGLEGLGLPVALEFDAGQRCPGKSFSGETSTTMPLLALRSAREYWLMPLVTTRPGSEVAATTWPPGHMQKL